MVIRIAICFPATKHVDLISIDIIYSDMWKLTEPTTTEFNSNWLTDKYFWVHSLNIHKGGEDGEEEQEELEWNQQARKMSLWE